MTYTSHATHILSVLTNPATLGRLYCNLNHTETKPSNIKLSHSVPY